MSADAGVTGLGFKSCLHCGVAVCLWQLTLLLSLSYSTCKMGGSEDSGGHGMRGACHRASAGDWGLAVAAVFIGVIFPLWEALSQATTAQIKTRHPGDFPGGPVVKTHRSNAGSPGQGIRSHTLQLRALMP